MTINNLFDICANINNNTGVSVYNSLADFENATPYFETFSNKRSMPAYIRNKKISRFEISKHSNTVFIALE